MNERIKELAKEAIANVRFWDAEKEAYDVGHDELGKFAELIVRECAEVVQEGRWMVPPSQEQLARSIKQHFGVEE